MRRKIKWLVVLFLCQTMTISFAQCEELLTIGVDLKPSTADCFTEECEPLKDILNGLGLQVELDSLDTSLNFAVDGLVLRSNGDALSPLPGLLFNTFDGGERLLGAYNSGEVNIPIFLSPEEVGENSVDMPSVQSGGTQSAQSFIAIDLGGGIVVNIPCRGGGCSCIPDDFKIELENVLYETYSNLLDTSR